jgi:hypothetical protein
MFYCEPCRVEQEWPTGFSGSYGKCEMCGKAASCYDVPSNRLPERKRPEPAAADAASGRKTVQFTNHVAYIDKWQTRVKDRDGVEIFSLVGAHDSITIDAALHAYERGYSQGKADGKREMQDAMKNLLGVLS